MSTKPLTINGQNYTVDQLKTLTKGKDSELAFQAAHALYENGKGGSVDLKSLINNAAELNISGGDIRWLMTKVIDKNSPGLNIALQESLQQRNQGISTLTNLLNSLHESAMSIIRNLSMRG